MSPRQNCQNSKRSMTKTRMPKHYRVGASVRFNNAVMKAMLRAGVRMGSFVILTVRGRKSGRAIQIPLVVFPTDGNRYLIAAYGVVNWVRNLRAADGVAAITAVGAPKRLPRSSCHPGRARRSCESRYARARPASPSRLSSHIGGSSSFPTSTST